MTGKERARLKSLASTEDTIIHVGKSGITPAVVASVDAALAAMPSPKLIAHSEERGDVHTEEALTQALLYRLRTMTAEALSRIAGMPI